MQGPVGLPGPAGTAGVPGEDGDKASNTLAKLLRIFKKLQGECFPSEGGACMSR